MVVSSALIVAQTAAKLMIYINVYKKVANTEEMVDLLNDIATEVKEGKLQSEKDEWEIIGTPEPTIES